MKLILISTRNSSRIAIDSFPYTLGRESTDLVAAQKNEEEKQALRHISKKHTTLSHENTDIFLNDAGSLNGTFLNKQKISDGKIIAKPGDVFSLAQKIDFIIDYIPATKVVSDENFILKSDTPGYPDITLDQFPFYLGDSLAEDTVVKNLDTSTQPADCVLSFENGKLFIAPLSRKHNVRVNGTKIPMGHTLLDIGNLISFAPSQEYRLNGKTVYAEPPQQDATKPPDQENEVEEDRTIYMEDATMFMNFFEKDEQNSEKIPGIETDRSIKTEEHRQSNLKNVLTNKTIQKSFAGAVLLLVVIIGTIFFYRSTDTYEANNLYKKGQYKECLVIVDNYLTEENNKKLNEIGTKSLVKLLAPPFINASKGQDYNEFNELLEKQNTLTTHIPGAQAIIEVFSYVSQVKSFSDHHNKSHSIDDDEWKKGTTSINRKWNDIHNEYKAMIDEISQVEPSLTEPFESFFSAINESQENEIYYINKINELERKMQSLLIDNDFESANKLLKKFSSTHTKLTNTDKWTKDLTLYISLIKLLDNIDIFNISSINKIGSPQTTLFQNAVNQYLAEKLPPQAVIQQIALAKRYWLNGQPDKAIAILGELPETQMQDKVSVKIAYLTKSVNYQAQLAAPDTESKCVILADLFDLIESEKTMLKAQYQDQFVQCRSRAQKLISQHSKKAVTAYKKYRDNNGISGQMRMESSLTGHFQKQAELLATALSESSFAKRTAEIFDIMLLKKTIVMFSEISEEHNTQMVRIKESVVLSGTLMHKKLALLELNEVNGWQD